MDAFEVRLTPQRVKNTRIVTQNREPVRLMMAPFSSKCVVTFEEIPVTKTARRFLIIENPLEQPLSVSISCKNTQKPIRNLQFEWLDGTVPALAETTVEITWTPAEPVACKETFFVTDQRGFKKELHIIFKSSGGKTAAANRMPLRARNIGSSNFLTVGNTKRNLKTPSPPMKKRVTGQRLSPLNDPPYKSQKPVKAPTPKRNNRRDYHCPQRSCHLYEDKENSPGGFDASDIFKNIQFTPAATEKNRCPSGIDYMASLPTPTLGEVHGNVSRCHNQSLLSGKKIVWSPIFEGIREEERTQRGGVTTTVTTTTTTTTVEEVKTPDIIVTQHEDCIQTKTVVREYFNVDLPEPPGDARRSLFEDEVEAPLLANTSTETYIKDLTINHEVNQTRILTPPTTATTHRQSHVFQAPFPLRDTIAKNVESIVTTPLQKKASESMRNLSSKKTREQEYLKLNQGSMPNLHEIESINSIENNRYYSQAAAAVAGQIQMEMQPPPVQRPYDSSFMLFQENEIRAQSSCSNLHELPDNTGLTKTNSERMLRCQDKFTGNGFSMTPAAHRVRNPFMTLSPPKSLTSTQKKAVDVSSAKWSQAVRLAAKAKREKEQEKSTQQSRGMHNLTDTNTLMRMACQVPMKQEKRRVFYDADMHVQAAINPDPFAATTTHDPFLSATMYLDERATDKYEKQFKNWLNALVTVPVDMDSNQVSVDVGKIFNEVRHNKKETVAQSKESVSCKYFTRYRMPLLRRAAVELYTSEAIVVPLSKLDVLIEKKQIGMREDRNLHLDLVLQRNILELLLCFNTLWLRIGLEVVFGEEIPLTSNADIYGLTSFVLNRLFRDKYLENKYSKNFALTAKYAEQIRKFALRKLLHLIVFLDAAKEQRIIKHNPCLFTRASQHKESKEILIKVASQLIANIGDITKYMKRLGIVLVHKQTYLDEFDYAFTNLAVDLRDGIRLTKVMEIILLRDDLTKSLRYPAVSRLQKIHNVDLGLKALQEADYDIHGEITPKDIVDGHREKTLSLLWQLIYRFRAPKFNAAATIVQRWWRVRMLCREIHYRVVARRQAKMQRAAVLIQKLFRGYRCRKMIPEYVRERTIATVVVQTYFRGFAARKKFLQMRFAAVTIQKWWQRNKEMHLERKRFVVLREATVAIQRRFRANLEMRKEFARFSELKSKVVIVQRLFRANQEMKQAVLKYTELKSATLTVQRKFRANQLMKEDRTRFLKMKKAALTIQRRFRDFRLMRLVKMDFVKMQYSATVIQRYFRGHRETRKLKSQFEATKSAALAVQRRFRANVAMREQRLQFVTLKRTVMFVEERYKAKTLAKETKMEYLRLKWATVTVQRQFRAQLQMKLAKKEYETKRMRIIQIQKYFRGFLAMQRDKERFRRVLWATRVIQDRFRAQRAMVEQRKAFEETRAATIKIQRWIRANKARDVCKEKFLRDRQLVVAVQRRWRAILLGRATREEFLKVRNAVVVIQRRFRATQEMRRVRFIFEEQRAAAVVLQRKWRARQLGIRVQKEFAQRKELIVGIQRRWRATLAMRKQKAHFLAMKSAAVSVQNRWRARMAMREAVAQYQQLRRFTVIVQVQWRAVLAMREERRRFLQTKESVIRIQSLVRGFLVRQEVRRQTEAVRRLQMYYRLKVEQRRCQQEYQTLKSATVFVQRMWRRKVETRRAVAEYQMKRELIVMVQRKFRAQQAMRREREQYLKVRKSVVVLQQRWMAVLDGRQARREMELKRRVIVQIQARVRGILARSAYRKLWYEKMSPEAIELRRQNVAALKIQTLWRGYRARKKFQSKAMRVVAQKISESRKVKAREERVTVKLFLGATMHKLKLGLNVSDATKIFRSLDFYSRVVPQVLVANCVQVARYCYTMLSQATRSEPHKYLIELCCRVTLNLARYEATKKQIFLYEYLETIGQMLLRWSDKECPIFNTLCTLIYVFIQTPSHKRIIHNYMTMRDGVFILRETKKAVIRKEKMLHNKQRLGVFRTQSTETDLEQLPTLECDYGMNLPTHLYVFKSRVFGFNTILNELAIELN